MDNQLIAKITELVLEKLAQGSQPELASKILTNEELQEWQSFRLIKENHHQMQQSTVPSYEALSTHELQHWQSLHQQSSGTVSVANSSDLIALKKFT
ncbi:hypothetical protein [Lysinibacillus capsici]|uniref:hypothetical protein n=1 Tax=Lysinibacillus capsici TaxID=2115968 RepID=UPI002A83A2CD|nr:hypothetical protein [Lysinibacillus capsici]